MIGNSSLPYKFTAQPLELTVSGSRTVSLVQSEATVSITMTLGR